MSSSFPPPHFHRGKFTEGLAGQCKTEIQRQLFWQKRKVVAVGSILSSEYSGDFRVSSSGPELSIGLFALGRIYLPKPKPRFWSPDADSASFSTRSREEQGRV